MLVWWFKVGGMDILQIILLLMWDEMVNFFGLMLEMVSCQLLLFKKDGIIQFVDWWNFEVLDVMVLQDVIGDDVDGGVYD